MRCAGARKRSACERQSGACAHAREARARKTQKAHGTRKTACRLCERTTIIFFCNNAMILRLVPQLSSAFGCPVCHQVTSPLCWLLYWGHMVQPGCLAFTMLLLLLFNEQGFFSSLHNKVSWLSQVVPVSFIMSYWGLLPGRACHKAKKSQATRPRPSQAVHTLRHTGVSCQHSPSSLLGCCHVVDGLLSFSSLSFRLSSSRRCRYT